MDLEHVDAVAHAECEEVAVVEGDGVVFDGHASVEPTRGVDGEAHGGLRCATGGDVDGGYGALMSVDGQLEGDPLGVACAAVANGYLDADVSAGEVGRSVEEQGVDVEVVGLYALQGYEGDGGEAVGGQRVEVAAGLLEVADDVGEAVCRSALFHEVELTAHGVAQAWRG